MEWYLAIPFKISSELKRAEYQAQTSIGVDLGLRHIAVVSEPVSGRRKFFSGKKIGYVRRHFRSLRKALGRSKALRAIKSAGKKEGRSIKDFNRKLACKNCRHQSHADLNASRNIAQSTVLAV